MADVGRGIGIGAPGLGCPVPSPGVTARLDVHYETTFNDGHVTKYHLVHEWSGYTAKEAADARFKRLKDAHADAKRDGLTITVRRARGDWITVETLAFSDTADGTPR
ncbi:hypothetical protein [Nocardioides sp. WS12]|uniref:hypothetical protein n=1 Tax=Nocardioides sp. WS12 TaxID=2486272 RepID=UPI0015F8B3D0|nr:hypothetical protein [Nocardioides sp. WS12]